MLLTEDKNSRKKAVPKIVCNIFDFHVSLKYLSFIKDEKMKLIQLSILLSVILISNSFCQITPEIQRQIDFIMNEKVRIKPADVLKYLETKDKNIIKEAVNKSMEIEANDPDMQISTSSYPMSEIHGAINPTDSNNIIVSAIEINTDNSSAAFNCPVYYTLDFGKTWNRSNFNTYPKKSSVMTLGGGDPILVFDKNGTVYISFINLYISLKNGSIPDSVFGAMTWAYSTNKGATWSSATNENIALSAEVYNGNGNVYGLGFFPDKQWMASDLSGSKYAGNVYTIHYRMQLLSKAPPTGMYVGTKKAGENFFSTSPVKISGTEATSIQFGTIDVDANGTVHAAYYGNTGSKNSFFYCKSTDGGASFSKPIKITDFTFNSGQLIPANGALDLITGITARRAYVCPQIFVDKSSSQYSGYLYFTYSGDGIASKKSKGMDVYLTRSTDGGNTWQTPKVISSNSDKQLSHQFYAACNVNNKGYLSIGFYDSQFEQSGGTDYRIIKSFDGGSTFTDTTNANTVSTYFSTVGLKNQNFGIGEYNPMLSTSSYSIPVWTDGRGNNGALKIYFRKIPFFNATDVPEITPINADFSLADIYPNPSTGLINLVVNSISYQDMSVEIFNISGDLQFKSSIPTSSGNSTIPLDLKNLTDGIYMLKLSGNDFYITRKLVIQK